MSHIIAARRSPVAPRNGALSSCLPHDLAAPVINALLTDAGVAPDQVGELIVSNALGAGGNPARLAILASDLPLKVAGLSVDRQCAGGMDAVLLGDAMIRAGLHDVVIAGGVESYSRRPVRMHQFADGRDPQPYDQAPFTPWPDRDPNMAQAADQLGKMLGITQAEQDEWAQQSHAKALAARDRLTGEITPVSGLTEDSFMRALSARHCARARPVSGTITAANMAVAADGAAFVLMVSDQVAQLFSGPSCMVTTGKTVGADPLQPGLSPVPAISAALSAANQTVQSLYCAEIMEAFAVQAIACQRESQLPEEIVNRHGGALARGHPIGASGAILAVRLFNDLTTRGGGIGLGAIAAAGGVGSALILEV